MEALEERNQNDSYQEYLEKLISLKKSLMENKEETVENANSQKGFAGPFILGFLTFLFEILFLLVSFLIFR